MALINGNQLKLYVGSDATRASTTTGAAGERIPFAHSQSVSLDISNSLIDVTTKDSNSWAEKISGQRSFTLSADGLVDDYTTATTERDLPKIGSYVIGDGSGSTQIYFEFGVGDARYVGKGFISSFSQSGGTDDAPTYSISVDGNGALTYDTDVTS